MPRKYAPRIIIDLEHGRVVDPEPVEKPVEEWEAKQRDKDQNEHARRLEAADEKRAQRDELRDRLKEMTKQSGGGNVADLAAAVLELLGDEGA